MITLSPCPKVYALDQDKAVTPEETLRTVKARLAGLDLDIAAEIRRIDVGRLGIPVFISRCGQDAKAVMPTRKQMGKGATPAQAEASALMELMERYGFFTFWRDRPEMVRLSWEEAEHRYGEALISVEEVARACGSRLSPDFSADTARALLGLRSWMFCPSLRIYDEKIVYVPLDLFRQLGEFNGSSAGNTEAESILQGACELVERHVCAVVDRDRPALPTIDPASAADPVLRELIDKFERAGVQVLLKDFTLGLSVPTVGVLAYDPATFPERSEIVFTAGTAISPTKAAVRALTEIAQLGGDFCTSACYEASGLPKFSEPREADFLREGPTVALDTLPDPEGDDILEELRGRAKALHAQGFNLYSVSTTNPDTQVPTHYNFVPGFAFREREKNASLGLFIGRMIAEEADPDEAERAYTRMDSLVPGAHWLQFFRGLTAMRREDHAEARRFFALAEPLQPEEESRALTAFYRAYTHTLDGDWEAARPGLTLAVELCPDMKEYHNLLGVCLFKLKRFEEAGERFAYILAHLDKGSAVDVQNLGLCRKFMGDTEAARHYLTAALELDPGLEAARTHLAELERQ